MINVSTFGRSILLFRDTYILLFTPLIFLSLPLYYNNQESRCVYVLLIMAVYWITEVIPLYVTALIPIFSLPLLGLMSSKTVASLYISEASIILTSGLIVALAIETSNFHRRLAMFIILKIGHSPKLLMAGFMLTTMILSMWIANVGATAIMIPVVEGILEVINKENEVNDMVTENEMGTEFTANENYKERVNLYSYRNIETSQQIVKNGEAAKINKTETVRLQLEQSQRLKYGYYLSIAYAANIGGTGVITGTPPNLVLLSMLSESFSEPTGVNFTTWMMLNIPGMALCTLFGWFWLQYRYIGFGKKSLSINEDSEKKIKDLILQDYEKLGPVSFQEKSVLFLFMMLVPLWIFREPGFFHGWGKLIDDFNGESTKLGDSVPVAFIVFLFFVLPANNPFQLYNSDGINSFRKSESLLNWNLVQQKVPWGLIILVGGGMAIAKASDTSGLSNLMAEELGKLNNFSPPILLILITSVTGGVTEILSNISTASIVLPVLRELSLELCINPLYFMIPATITASFAFMLPVATPPNAMVYYAGEIPSIEMMKTGFLMNVICIAVVNGVMNTLGGLIFNLHSMPTWANSSTSGNLPNC